MSMRDPRETLIGWLNDAYAMEQGLVQVLENHANDAKDMPDAYRKLTQHLEQTRMHAERVRECVERLGGSTSAMKTAMGTVSGFVQGRSTGASPDELVKNALADYASEHLEIASYRALIVAARALGENHVVQVCEQILSEEEEMASWLERQLPMIVQDYLGQGATVGAGTATGGSFSGTPGGNRF